MADIRGTERQATVSLAALDWSVSAMSEVTSRLTEPHGRALVLQQTAATAVSDATWWVTLVDSTLARDQPREYEAALAALTPRERDEITQALAGLRYVRNQMGARADLAGLIRSDGGTWSWGPLPDATASDLPPNGQEQERGRYHGYQDWLAGRPVAATFTVAARFLGRVAASLPPRSSLTALLRSRAGEACARQRDRGTISKGREHERHERAAEAGQSEMTP